MSTQQITPHEKDHLSSHGWLELYVLSPSDLMELARTLGAPHPTHRGGPFIDRLMPTEKQQARPGTMSSYLGLDRFPFHTDGAYLRVPPRFILLRLADGARSARPTLICALSDIPFTVDDIQTFRRDVWTVRGSAGPFLSPILSDSTVRGHTVMRFDPFCMKPASSKSVRSARIFESALEKANPADVTWASNKTLVLDNWRVLHARGEGPLDYNEGRVLERISVISPGG